MGSRTLLSNAPMRLKRHAPGCTISAAASPNTIRHQASRWRSIGRRAAEIRPESIGLEQSARKVSATDTPWASKTDLRTFSVARRESPILFHDSDMRTFPNSCSSAQRSPNRADVSEIIPCVSSQCAEQPQRKAQRLMRYTSSCSDLQRRTGNAPGGANGR